MNSRFAHRVGEFWHYDDAKSNTWFIIVERYWWSNMLRVVYDDGTSAKFFNDQVYFDGWIKVNPADYE